ncbi:terminase gpA endonuclease subunit [Roseiconus lacunae]|uniref:Phage terminase large subunit family protein n=1 Tax=Roseiconus lacunae TaxID=2605694 RepID=A0ABT7PHJ2_9BACT|nr:terminase gpA endonuclease subunit [Roseiconus lacunae]MDM4015969.1 phage terminase large subunit family protein [Roseiconus lacunae]
MMATAKQRDGYEAHKQRAAKRSREQAAAGTDIGSIPRVRNGRRKKRCGKSLKAFCESYFPDKFYYGFSADHLRLIDKLERAVLNGELLSLAMPRGSGKTTLCECAALWALLYGHRSFVVLVGADKEAAQGLLQSVVVALETNDRIENDFPEVCYPIQCIERTASRCKKQTCNGVHTRMVYADDKLVFPTVKGSKCSGSMIVCRGLLGRIRGLKHSRADGQDIRPDLCIVDDPQTEESSQSIPMCRKRVKVLTGGILGLAGPGKSIAGMMPCTVLEPGDMADQILDRDLYPQWQGERVAFVKSWPVNRDLWDKYVEILRDDLKHERGRERATQFYRDNFRAMREGFEVYWEDRFDREKGEIDARQHFFNKLVELGPEKCASEMQNDPKCKELIKTCVEFDWHVSRTKIANKCSGYDWRVVPDTATKITAMIDVHLDVLYYGVAAWTDEFTGYVIDYGTWPDQPRRYFEKSTADHTMRALYPEAAGQSDAAVLHVALADLCDEILGRTYTREDGTEQHVDRCLIDANYGPESATVYEFCKLSPYRSIFLPSHGKPIGINKPDEHARPAQRGEVVGWHWRMPPLAKTTKQIRYINFTPNRWKVFLFQRLAAARGAIGCLELPGTEPEAHLMLADHCHAETPAKAHGTYGERVLFGECPPGVDNHFFDVLVGLCVGASREGCKVPTMAMDTRGDRRKRSGGRKKRLSQLR